MNTDKIKRKCGFRKEGKIYFGLSNNTINDYGIPWELFVLDPILPINNLEISAQGVTVLPSILGYNAQLEPVYQRNNDGVIIYHAYDWVGSDYTVAEFWEELQEKGLSRLNPKNTQFDLLTMESKYILVFPHGCIDNPSQVECPLNNEHQPHETCFGNLLQSEGDYPGRVFQFPIHIGDWEVIKTDDTNIMNEALQILENLQAGIGRVQIADY